MTSNESEGLPVLDFLLSIINFIVELYLSSVIKAFLCFHDKFYSWLNTTIRNLLDENSDKIPKWFTANFITYARTWLVVPCVILMTKGFVVVPSLILIAVDFGDFLDGVVARYWVERKEIEAVGKEIDDNDTKDKPTLEPSWIIRHREKTYGGFIDAVCDKAFLIPCWISLLSTVPNSSHVNTIQYAIVWSLILIETASGSIRFKAFYTSNGITAPVVKGLDFSTSAVKADGIGKAKQTLEMVGSALFILPIFRYAGLLLMSAAVPLAYESVRRKIKKRVIYVDGTVENIDHEILKFWKQARGLGSKLIVGVSEDNTDMVKNASACESVDSVLLNAPTKLSVAYLDKIGVDFVVCGVGNSASVVTSEIAAAQRCLIIVDDNTAQPAKSLDTKNTKTE